MAFERVSDNKITGDSLDSFVGNLVTLFKRQMTIRNAEDESRFNTAVNEDNLSLDDQLAYRKDQLSRVSDDPEERRRVRGEISSLKKRIEEQKFTDDYSGKLQDFQTGLASIDSVIQFLKDQDDATDNIDIHNLIAGKLADAEGTKFKLTQELIKNNSDYAENSRSVSVIDDQITKVNSYRTKALLSGNDQLVSVYDLQLQGLNTAKNNMQVQNDILGLGAVSATGAYSATTLLDVMNNKIASVGSTGPVKVGDTTYASAKDFWTYKRDAYLSDSGNSGFFSQFNNELKNDLATKESKNLLTIDTVKSATSAFNALSARPEMANYARQIDLYRQDVLQDGANKLATSVANEFNRTLDVNKAVSSLSAIKSLGVNIDDVFTKILQSNAANKNAQVSNILSAAQTAMQNDPNLTPDMAIAQAVASGAGTMISPEQAAGTTEKGLATEAAGTAAAGAGTIDPRTTVGAPAEPANTPQASGNINGATLTGLPNLTPGMRSEDVKTLQNYLIQQGFNIASGATGLYGPETQAAVAEFQKKNSIDTGGNPGFFGPRTKSFLAGNQTTTSPAPASTPAVNQPTPSIAPAPAPAPTPTAPAVSSGYTFKKTPDGNVEIYQNGNRISTGSMSYAKSLGYSGA